LDKYLYYDKEENVMFDENGYNVPDIFDWVTTNQLYVFKHKKQTMECVNNEREQVVVLIYPETNY